MERFAPPRAGNGASERDSLVPIARLELGFRATLRTGSNFGCSGWYTALSLAGPFLPQHMARFGLVSLR